MRLTVSSISEAGIEEEAKFPLTLNGVTLEDEVTVALTASRFKEKVLIDGRVRSEAFLLCSRCLKKIPFPLNISFNVEYMPYSGSYGESEHELSKRELDVSSYRNDEIDIEDLVREQILLAVPMKPLCRSDCRGICPECGRDLNESFCKCSTAGIDPRLAPLEKFKESLESQTADKNKDAP